MFNSVCGLSGWGKLSRRGAEPRWGERYLGSSQPEHMDRHHAVQISEIRFLICPRKKVPLILIPVGFPGPGLGKLGGCFYLNFRALGARQMRVFPLVFWQSGLITGIFHQGQESGHFAGISGMPRREKEPIRGLFLLRHSQSGDLRIFPTTSIFRKYLQKKLFKQPVVRRFIRDENIVRMALGHAGIGDPDELGIGMHIGNCF